MKKRSIAIVTALALFLTTVMVPFGMQDASAAENTYTKALGSIVQSFEKRETSFKLSKESRFFIVSDTKPDSDLMSTVGLCCSEFAAKKKPSSTPLAIVYGDESLARAGDIVIRFEEGKYLDQNYRLSIGEKVILSASDYDAVFYGLRTLLKYRIASESNTLAGAYIKDYPDVKERVVHLDCARKYFSSTWIKNFIKKSSWQGYNAIEIHFSEDQGLRLESKKYPWLAGSYNGSKGVITQEQMASICEVAERYHMEVIPSFDSPGHLNYMTKRYRAYVKKHPDYSFRYNGKKYSAKKYSGFKNISNYFKYKGDKSGYTYLGINLANPVARAFTNSLIDEYADFFKKQGCTKFNIGGDELNGWTNVTLAGRTFTYDTRWYALQHWDSYAKKTLDVKNGNAVDTYIKWMNSTATRLEKKGYRCRMWNDEVYRMKTQHVALKKSIDIVFWSNSYASLSKLKGKNFRFYNAISTWTYYVTKPSYRYVTGERIYNGWNPKSFADPTKKAKTVPKSQYLGAYFCIWCDYATINTTKDVWNDVKRRMWSNSVKMWNRQVNTADSGSGKKLSYKSYSGYVDKMNLFPGYSGKCTSGSYLPKYGTITRAE